MRLFLALLVALVPSLSYAGFGGGVGASASYLSTRDFGNIWSPGATAELYWTTGAGNRFGLFIDSLRPTYPGRKAEFVRHFGLLFGTKKKSGFVFNARIDPLSMLVFMLGKDFTESNLSLVGAAGFGLHFGWEIPMGKMFLRPQIGYRMFAYPHVLSSEPHKARQVADFGVVIGF